MQCSLIIGYSTELLLMILIKPQERTINIKTFALYVKNDAVDYEIKGRRVSL